MTSAILNQGPEVERSGFHSKQAVVYNPKNLKRQVRTHMNQGPKVEKSGFHSKQAVVYSFYPGSFKEGYYSYPSAE